jgi:hypothetical protein
MYVYIYIYIYICIHIRARAHTHTHAYIHHAYDSTYSRYVCVCVCVCVCVYTYVVSKRITFWDGAGIWGQILVLKKSWILTVYDELIAITSCWSSPTIFSHCLHSQLGGVGGGSWGPLPVCNEEVFVKHDAYYFY